MKSWIVAVEEAMRWKPGSVGDSPVDNSGHAWKQQQVGE